MEIRHHALLYALICKNAIESLGKKTGEDLIGQFTKDYGRKRGQRMASHTPIRDMNGFFISSEWKGNPGENISSTSYHDDRTESTVTRCAWYETWKEYGLERYGSFYCRYIDKAICEGYDGDFGLELKSAIGLGDERCLFSWSAKADRKKVEESERRYVLPFDHHCRELLECAAEVLPGEVIKKAKQDFRSLSGESL